MKKKIAILTDCLDDSPSSTANYTKNFVKELIKINKEFEIFLIHGKKTKEPLYKSQQIKEILITSSKKRRHKYFLVKLFYRGLNKIRELIRNYKIKRYCEKEKIDILHIPHLAAALAPSISFIKHKFKLVVTLHGVSPLTLPPNNYYEKEDIITKLDKIITAFHSFKWRFVFKNRFELMITVSRSEKKDISKELRISPRKIVPIYHGVDHKNFRVIHNKDKIREKLAKKYGIEKKFLLHVSAYQPKKNTERIIRAFKIAKNKYKIDEKLCLIGRNFEKFNDLINFLDLKKDVLYLGFMNHEELKFFYNLATVFIFPSYHESFGMPIIEAMACGCPVITSNVTACPEVAGDAALLVNPGNTKELAEAIYKVVSNAKLRKELKKKGLKRAKEFTWEKCAREHLSAYKKILKNE